MRASFTLTGFRGLQAALEHGTAAMRLQVSLACQQTARAVQQRARANAPKDRGDLAAAISVSGKGLNWRVGVVDRDLPWRGGKNSAHRNPSVYGVWFEYGFKHRRIARHPFMGPAADAERGPHQDRLRDAVADVGRTVAA